VGTYSGTTLMYNGATCTNGKQCIAPLSPLVQVSGDKRQSAADIGVPQQLSVDDTHGFSGNISYKLAPWAKCAR
jgi:iron complex outermembrane receptor protein